MSTLIANVLSVTSVTRSFLIGSLVHIHQKEKHFLRYALQKRTKTYKTAIQAIFANLSLSFNIF